MGAMLSILFLLLLMALGGRHPLIAGDSPANKIPFDGGKDIPEAKDSVMKYSLEPSSKMNISNSDIFLGSNTTSINNNFLDNVNDDEEYTGPTHNYLPIIIFIIVISAVVVVLALCLEFERRGRLSKITWNLALNPLHNRSAPTAHSQQPPQPDLIPLRYLDLINSANRDLEMEP